MDQSSGDRKEGEELRSVEKLVDMESFTFGKLSKVVAMFFKRSKSENNILPFIQTCIDF